MNTNSSQTPSQTFFQKHLARTFAAVAILLGFISLQSQGLRDGLVAEWDFNETSGLSASDSTGSNNGTLIDFSDDTSHWGTGVHGGAITFNGANYVEVPDAPAIGADLVNGFSVSAWFRSNVELDAGGSGNRMLEKRDSYFFLQGVATGGMNFLVKQGGANRTVGIGETLAPNVWHHIVGVFDGTDAHAYIGGELKGSVSVGGPIDDAQLPLLIGADDSGNFFDGSMDQVLIWNRSLNSEEVVAVFNNELDFVASEAPTIAESPSAQTLYAGSTISLSVTATGARPFRYLWHKDGDPVRSATESTYAIGNVTAADAGNYTVRVSNAAGEVFSDAATATVLPVTGLNSGRLAYWKFDESSGTSAADSAGSSNGSLIGFTGGAFKTGKINNGLAFDGFGSFVAVDNSSALDALGPDATIAFWVNLNSYGEEQDAGNYTLSASYVLRKGDQFNVRIVNDPGTITRTVAVRAGSGADAGGIARKNFEVNSRQGTTELNSWQHWTITYNGGVITFFLDGIPLGDPVEGSLGEPDLGFLTIGAFDDSDTSPTFLDGLLDEISIWDRPISEAEILEIAGKDISGAPAIEVQPTAQKKLEGTTVSLSVVATGKRPVSYQWMIDGNPIDDGFDRILTLRNLRPNNAGQYTVAVKNELGETTSEPAELVVEALGAITSGLVAHYTFDESSGETISDSSGNDINGTLSNFDGGGHEPGVIGGGLRFDGEDDFVEIAHHDLLNLTTEGTISVWLNPFLFSGGTDFDRVFRKDVTYDFVLLTGDLARVHGINKDPYPTPPGTVEREVWQHFAYVVRNNTIQWYKNGQSVGSALPGQLGGLNTLPLVLGNYEIQDDNWINRPYQGVMDDLGIWQRALTPTELDGIYQNGLKGKPLTEEFEPLNIRSASAVGPSITLTYYNPFPARDIVVQSSSDVGSRTWKDEANFTIADLGDSVFKATLAASGTATFFRIAALEPPPIFFEDFESGASGWTHQGDGDNWQLGTPTTGPGQAFSGDNVYATGLSADFLQNANNFLISPVIDLTEFTQVTVSFQEFRNMDPPENGEFYHGARVSVVDADSLSAIEQLSLERGTSSDWEERRNKLGPDSVGRRIRLEFNFFSDAFPPNEGWFIDDVSVTAE